MGGVVQMSKRREDRGEYSHHRYGRYAQLDNRYYPTHDVTTFQMNNCFCNLNMLAILILIILQFGKKQDKYQLIDNSILFIITLYYLSCCVKCR